MRCAQQLHALGSWSGIAIGCALVLVRRAEAVRWSLLPGEVGGR